MKQRKRRGLVIFRNLFLILLLGVACVGGTMLAVCSFEDPVLFSEITAPVTGFFQSVGDGVRDTVDSIEAQIARLRAEAEARRRAKAEAKARAKAEAEAKARAEAEAKAAAEAAALEAGSPEAEAQVAGRPNLRKDFVPADPTITELIVSGGQEYLLGGNVLLPYFNQADEAWAAAPFGVDPVGSHGCGPTALSMAVSGLTGETVTPAEMAAWTAGAGQAAPNSGSYLTIVEVTAEHFGLNYAPVEPLDAETLCSQLRAGGVMVALMGPGHFTNGGHFILLHGVTLSGEVLVADPYSRENSLMTWDPQLLIDELSPSRHAGAPLWALNVSTEL